MRQIIQERAKHLNFVVENAALGHYQPTENQAISNFKDLVERHKNKNFVYINHMHLPNDNMLSVFAEHNRSVAFINMLRRPFDRLRSLYDYSRWGNRPKHLKDEALAVLNVSFVECVRLGHEACAGTTIFENYLSGKEYFSSAPHDSFHIASTNLLHTYTVVGTVENFSLSIKLMEAILPQFFRGSPSASSIRHANVSPHENIAMELSDNKFLAHKAQIMKSLSGEHALYELATDKMRQLALKCDF